ncbi:MAG: restriction endonuclease subunit S [Rhodobacterales bacterium]|nr:restriction endonuclease subunit S [Rhodobacterales bacterium]
MKDQTTIAVGTQRSGWKTIPLGDLCKMYQPKTIGKKDMSPDGAYPVFGANGIIGRYHEFNHEKPQLVVGCRGACGSVHITEPFSWITGNTMVIQPKSSNIDLRFLEYFFRGAADIEGATTGAAQPQITQTSLKPIAVPLPLMDEQKRIVAVLDQAFAALDRARAHAEANLADAGELFENSLTAALESSGTDLELGRFDDPNLISIVDGDRGRNYPKKSDFQPEGHCLFLNTKNVRPNGFEFSEMMFISKEKDAALGKGKLQKRDVILTTRGTVGNVGFFGDNIPFECMRINSGMLILRPNEKRLRSEYLFTLLRSKAFKSQIYHHVSGAAQPQLPIRSLKQFTLPMPESTEQQMKVVSALLKVERRSSALKESYATKLADIADLRQSLLQKAFSGQLT